MSLDEEPQRSSEDYYDITTTVRSGNMRPKTRLQISDDLSLLLLTSLGFMQQYILDVTKEE